MLPAEKLRKVFKMRICKRYRNRVGDDKNLITPAPSCFSLSIGSSTLRAVSLSYARTCDSP